MQSVTDVGAERKSGISCEGLEYEGCLKSGDSFELCIHELFGRRNKAL